MYLYDKLLSNEEYLSNARKIEQIKFITDGKWDWEHGLGHYKRVAKYVKDILIDLNADDRTIDLGMTAALLHDIGLVKGTKTDHALESSRIFTNFIDEKDISQNEIEVLRQAIMDHSNGSDIKSLVGLSLVLADKLDITYHRTISSSIQDTVNKEIQKIKDVKINITDDELIVSYITEDSFDVNILKNWPKAIKVPYKVSSYLNKKYIFKINDKIINISEFIN